MIFEYCPNCKAYRGFKRHFTIWTLILVCLTWGAWILALPFYPKRCIVCGMLYDEARKINKKRKQKEQQQENNENLNITPEK